MKELMIYVVGNTTWIPLFEDFGKMKKRGPQNKRAGASIRKPKGLVEWETKSGEINGGMNKGHNQMDCSLEEHLLPSCYAPGPVHSAVLAHHEWTGFPHVEYTGQQLAYPVCLVEESEVDAIHSKVFKKDYSSKVCGRKEKPGSERTMWQQLWEFGPKVGSMELKRKELMSKIANNIFIL